MINNFNKNQLQLKLLDKNLSSFCKTIYINTNLFGMESLYDTTILEALFLLEYFTGSKPYISHYKKKFKEINIQIMNTLRKKNTKYFLDILKIFYLPILYRRNISVNSKQIFSSMFTFTITNINVLSFVPDIFFKWNKSLNCFFSFYKKDDENILLFLQYLGFHFYTIRQPKQIK